MGRDRKKRIAGLLAAVLALNVFWPTGAVHAAITSDVSNSGVLEGIINKNVFNIELPVVPENVVSGNVQPDVPVFTLYDFFMDPKNLMPERYEDKRFEPNTNLYFLNKEEGTSYDYSHISDALMIRNKSTMNVDVELKASIEGLDGIRLTRDNGFVDDTRSSVYLAIMDSSKKTAPMDAYGSFLKTTLKGSPNAYKVIYDASDGQYKYVLKTDAELRAGGITFADYTFRLTGACNTKSSWSDLPEDIAPVITAIWKVSPRRTDMSPSIGKDKYVMTGGKGIAIEVDLGEGLLAAKGIKRITFENPTGGLTVFPTTNYKFEGGRLIINASCITKLVEAGITSREYTVIFDDEIGTEAKFSLLNDNIAPSIEKTSYNIESGKDVQINIDLGSGDYVADGIKSITFTKGTETVIFPDTNYVITGGRLVIDKSCITKLIKGGVTSREYTVTFNNKANTQAKFTLNVDGSAPSVADASDTYTMAKDTDVSVNLDLGAGYLEAQGIKGITYADAAGGAVTLSATDYTFAKDTGKLIINRSCVNSMIQGGVVSREYTIIFDNVAETKVQIILRAEDKDPSIVGDTTYPLVSGKGIAITIDLGSGPSKANSIKMITFVKDGTVTTFPTANYRFEEGKLIITRDCVDRLFSNGLTSRDYTVTFDNDKTVNFTLRVDGTAPSITNRAYTIIKGNDVVIDVNEGTGSLTATGIKEITFVKSGVTTTFPTANYAYTGGRLTINKTCITNLIQGGLISREYTVVFKNAAETKVNIVLTAQDTPPSIVGGTSYTMTNGRGVAVNFDLGSGQSRATGIKTVTFVKNGVTTEFPTSNYRVEDEKLIINSTCISKLLSSGLTSREYTITFNNSSSTQARFTLRR